MLRELAQNLPKYFCVFHNRDSALHAIRFALSIERTVDIGKFVHLRNDALRNFGNVSALARTCRAAQRVVPSATRNDGADPPLIHRRRNSRHLA